MAECVPAMSCKDSVQTTAEPASELHSDGTDRSVEHEERADRRALPGLCEDLSWDPTSAVKDRTSLQPSRKQRLTDQLKMQQSRDLEQQPEGDSSDDDVSSSNERMERRYRTRGRRGGRRRRKNREADWPDARAAEGGAAPLLYEGYEGMPPGYPGPTSFFPTDLEEMTKSMSNILASAAPLHPYWRPPMQPLLGPAAPAAMPLVSPAPGLPTPPLEPEEQRARPTAAAEQEKQMQRMLFELLDSHIVALLPEGAPEVDRRELTRTLLSVYEQLQTLKTALGEKTTLSLLQLMMQTGHHLPVNGEQRSERRSRAGSDEPPRSPSSGPVPASSAQEHPELLQPTPTSRPAPGLQQHLSAQPARNPNLFRGPEDPTDGSPVSRPPTESPGPNQMTLIPSNLLEEE